MMADRQQETVTAVPLRLCRTIFKRMEIRRCKHIGNPGGLADISLSMHFAHQQCFVPNVPRTLLQ